MFIYILMFKGLFGVFTGSPTHDDLAKEGLKLENEGHLDAAYDKYLAAYAEGTGYKRARLDMAHILHLKALNQKPKVYNAKTGVQNVPEQAQAKKWFTDAIKLYETIASINDPHNSDIKWSAVNNLAVMKDSGLVFNYPAPEGAVTRESRSTVESTETRLTPQQASALAFDTVDKKSTTITIVRPNLKESLLYFEEAHAGNPADKSIAYNLGVVYYKLSELQKKERSVDVHEIQDNVNKSKETLQQFISESQDKITDPANAEYAYYKMAHDNSNWILTTLGSSSAGLYGGWKRRNVKQKRTNRKKRKLKANTRRRRMR